MGFSEDDDALTNFLVAGLNDSRNLGSAGVDGFWVCRELGLHGRSDHPTERGSILERSLLRGIFFGLMGLELKSTTGPDREPGYSPSVTISPIETQNEAGRPFSESLW